MLLAALLLAAPELSACPPVTIGPGLWDQQVIVGSTARAYHLYVPKTPMPKGGYPLVISFHPAASSAAGHAATTHLRDEAEEAGFVLVEPEGFSGNFGKRSWNAGFCCGAAADAQVDDVGFVRALVAKVKSDEVCVDERRVFAVGHANGGMLAHRLGCEMSDVFAAVASVAGAMSDVQGGVRKFACGPTRPISVLEIHGTADKCHPMDGGKGAGLDAVNEKRSVRATMDEWRERDQCSKKTRMVRKTGALTCRTFDKCPGGIDVTLCEVQDQGHGWPGSDKYELATLCGGQQVSGVDANGMIWAFFNAHSKP
jgi:polyhydroxybutyrate depolymerase